MKRTRPVTSTDGARAQANLDPATVEGFGDEWAHYDQSRAPLSELSAIWQDYFTLFPWDRLHPDPQGLDIGCGSGRWARFVTPRVGRLYCVDASAKALRVAEANLRGFSNCTFARASIDALPVPDGSMDFAYSLGVLHHVPDTLEGLRSCVAKLKRGAPFLIYLYYAFDNRPAWFKLMWKASDVIRKVISRMPRRGKIHATRLLAWAVYWPLARGARVLEAVGFSVSSFPLASYRSRSIYCMQTDALDRFGTPLEHRFTRSEIETMMRAAGLEDIRFSPREPFWCALGYKA